MIRDAAPVLAYTVSPGTVPCNSTRVQLMIVAENDSDQAVELARIQLTIPCGTGGTDLALTTLGVSGTGTGGWSIGPTGVDGVLVAEPAQGGETIGPGAQIAFTVSGFVVNGTIGAATIEAAEKPYRGTLGASAPVATVNKSKQLAIEYFYVNQVAVDPGSPVTVEWSVVNASSQIVYIQGTATSSDRSGQLSSTLQENTVFTLAATSANRDEPLIQQIIVLVSGLRITSFDLDPDKVEPGQPCHLEWTTENAQYAVLTLPDGQLTPDGNPSTEVPVDGKYPITPSKTCTYTLTAISATGKQTSLPAVVLVHSPTIRSFQAIGDATVYDPPVTLAWTTEHATDVSIDAIGKVPPSGTMQVAPLVTTTYTLSASSSNGKATPKQATAVIQPRPAALSAAFVPNAMNAFAWIATNVDSVIVNNTVHKASNSTSVGSIAGSRATMLICPKNGVPIPIQTSKAGSATLVANPTTLAAPGTTQLTWSVVNGQAPVLAVTDPAGRHTTMDVAVGVPNAVAYPCTMAGTYVFVLAPNNGMSSLEQTVVVGAPASPAALAANPNDRTPP